MHSQAVQYLDCLTSTTVWGAGTENTYQYDQNNFIEKMNEDGIGVTVNGNTATCMINGKKVDISYDITNRLKKIDGDMNEYWYDADNNRINMYYYHTNMKYAYDCSGGRSRLVWTSDHNLNVSSYYYGAEGLLWSRCNGEYQVYHYDYRGSVVAVTDIDGNVTDTLKYDAYGSTIERTGESALIFGYNGQYGVLTDPNGLLYMRTRFYNPDLKRFMNADVIDGSIADSTTLNLYTYVNGNPISFVDPFGLSAERGNNNKNVINDLHWLFNCSYDYFSSYKNEAERIRATNDAVMKFLISDRFYNASTLKGVAWDMLAGELDMGYFIYMSQHSNFLSVRESTFYDLDSGEEIDFLHMIATLCAYNYESTSGALFTIPSAYAGWAGDLITLAGDVADKITSENDDIVELTKKLMRTGDCSFPKSDLIGDIDAVLINEYLSTMPIDKAFEAYYASDYKDRYSKFFAKEFGGYIDNVYSSAEHYLSPGLYNFAFRKAFHSKYSNDIIPYVAQGFTEYFVYEAGR